MNFIELFAGAGGTALGLEKAGLKPILLIEKDKDCYKTLHKNRPHWNILNEDVSQINFRDYIDTPIISAGFPCQSYSFAGKRLGLEDDRGKIIFDVIRIVYFVQPLVFIGENVKGLLAHNNGETFNLIKSIFEEIGYKVYFKILNAFDYGVPQKRERLIMIATKLDKEFEFPTKQDNKVFLRDILTDAPHSEGYTYSQSKIEIFKQVPEGGNWRDLPLEVQKEYLGKSFYSGGGKTGIAKRLSYDEPSLTILCSPSQKQTERCHPEFHRPLTIRECARIQTFPDSWSFKGSIASQYRQIGNALPVKLAYEIGKSVLDYLEK